MTRRTAAWFLDLICAGVLSMGGVMVFFLLAFLFHQWILPGCVQRWPSLGSVPIKFMGLVVFVTINGLLMVLFLLSKDAFSESSPGKWFLGLKVVDNTSHQPIGLGQSIKRNLVMVFGIPLVWYGCFALFCLVALGMALTSLFHEPALLLFLIPLLIGILLLVVFFWLGRVLVPNGWRLGERWANTRVVETKPRWSEQFDVVLICHRCQYDLRGNVSSQCPECGAPLTAMQQWNLDQQAKRRDESPAETIRSRQDAAEAKEQD